jgi:uncharacterized membrane protein
MNPFLRLARERRDALRLFAVLVLSTFAALALLAFRVYYSGSGRWLSLAWDLFLAWLPFWFALPLAAPPSTTTTTTPSADRRSSALPILVFGFLWLLFFPNAPYLLTEFMHLANRPWLDERPIGRLAGISPAGFVPPWYDVMMVVFFAWTGLLLGLVSLHVVHAAVAARWGRRRGWAMVVAVAWLSGLGISLGRFQRWNSWDLFTQPHALLPDVLGRIVNPLAHPRTTAVTILFATFLLMAYATLAALMRLRREPAAAPVTPPPADATAAPVALGPAR